MLYIIAAVFTLAAWGVQAYVTAVNKSNKLNPLLPLLYSVTCILFLVDAIIAGSILYIVLNAVLLILLAAICFSLFKQTRAG
jgi:ABC-type polysaccharide/polyol phosphate export permease